MGRRRGPGAGEAGYRTGEHARRPLPWTKGHHLLDWQAYHERNRLMAASPYQRAKLVRESLENHVKRLMSMQYSTLASNSAHAGPPGRPGRAPADAPRRRAPAGVYARSGAQYDDGRIVQALDEFPSPRLKKPPRCCKGIPGADRQSRARRRWP